MPKGKESKVLAQNRKASHDYFILETIEAGMQLYGTEIKSVRKAKINLKDGYISIRNGEAWLKNVHISPFEQGNIFNHDPLRDRKLLLHKKQIIKLNQEIQQSGLTVVPLKVYIKDGFAKVLIGLAKGKKNYDKRQSLRDKAQKRDIDREMKQF
ncbi:MAG: SsrA-binding protein SmpB [Bavariicoccus seileri]|uniref:SsrA-binding protein n=1 Tax=Bavariicoccus seileri TaxID=549685 RepID=A0A3D4S380_9ENTE|nr:SsrA-binding protein SmpB [Bavariicoccus seileri]HCS93283.1 SsrA-binding protein SmpB [Bavariicoccus seileri]